MTDEEKKKAYNILYPIILKAMHNLPKHTNKDLKGMAIYSELFN
ncbi:MAG: hypothetical protein ACUZ8E_16475 [Candidatus Anammoxibacter sp.]